MLSCEDSKRLKELGYDQELKEGDWYYREPDGEQIPLDRPAIPEVHAPCFVCLHDSHNYELYPPHYVKVPTTDGMIEGLKKAYSCFHTLSINIFDGGVSVDFVLTDPVTQFLSAKIIGFGDSVEEALCSVWKERKG